MLYEKAKGAQIRARAKYIEEEKRSKPYFLNLEKQHQKQNIITELASNTEYKDNTGIVHHMTCFHQN